jgi:hypothetical protein
MILLVGIAGGGKSMRELFAHPLAQQQRWRAIAIKTRAVQIASGSRS